MEDTGLCGVRESGCWKSYKAGALGYHILTGTSRGDWSSFVPSSKTSGISFLEKCEGGLKKTCV